MKIITNAQQNQRSSAVLNIQAVIASNKDGHLNADAASGAIHMESEGMSTDTQEAIEGIALDLKDTPFWEGLKDGVTSTNEAEITSIAGDAVEMAALSLMQSKDPASYAKELLRPFKPISGEINVNPGQNEFGYTFEGFDPSSVQNHMSTSAVLAAKTHAGEDKFTRLFYPRYVLAANLSAMSLEINLPMVVTNVEHNVDGTPVDFNKISLADLIHNSSLLKNNATDIYPFAEDAVTPEVLAVAADVPDVVVSVGNTNVNTRPILMQKKVSLIGISNAPLLLNGSVFDRTDSLEQTVIMRDLYIRASVMHNLDTTPVEGAYVIFKVDVSSQLGSLFQQTSDGSPYDYHITMSPEVILRKTTPILSGDRAVFDTEFEGLTGIVAGTPYAVGAMSESLSAKVNLEYSDIYASADPFIITGRTDENGDAVEFATLATATDGLVLTAFAYLPDAKRKNRNLRHTDIQIDPTNVTVFNYPVELGGPITLPKSIGNEPTAAEIDIMTKIITIDNTAKAISSLRASMDQLKTYATTNVLPKGNSFIGSLVVNPTYIERDLDVAVEVASLASASALPDLRGAIIAGTSAVIEQAIEDSKMIAGLSICNKTVHDLKINMVTSPSIANKMWESGDSRTFGENRSAEIAEAVDVFFQDRIIITFGLKDADRVPSILNWGMHVHKPAITYDWKTVRNDAHLQELTIQGSDVFYALCPVIAVINIINLDQFYTA